MFRKLKLAQPAVRWGDGGRQVWPPSKRIKSQSYEPNGDAEHLSTWMAEVEIVGGV